jgi:hypothetical protein
MIYGDGIPALINLLLQRQVSLFHALQLRDLRNFLELGGIPSRAHQELHGKTYTCLDTDANDRDNGVWDKVFANLDDFGRVFAHGGVAVPNAFGPITLQLQPHALAEATDVAVCLRSAGAAGFQRPLEALGSVEAVDGLFAEPSNACFPYSANLRTRSSLSSLRPNSSLPEVSLTVPCGKLDLEHVLVAWVDPYTLGGRLLVEHIQELVARSRYTFEVRERSCQAERRVLYDEMAKFIRNSDLDLIRWMRRPDASEELRQWSRQIWDAGLGFQHNRFARYLRDGTLSQIKGA